MVRGHPPPPWQARSLLHARVSAAAADADAYVAIGFRPVSRERVAPAVQALVGSGMQALFGMKGADIVVGSAAGVQTMYAEKFTGPPERKSYLSVSNASAAVEDGRVSLAFTRPLVDGKAFRVFKLNVSILVGDAIWAAGRFDASADFPTYHDARGLRMVTWEDPSPMAPWACA